MTSSATREITLRRGRSKIGCDGCGKHVLAVYELAVERKKVAMLCRACCRRPLGEIIAEHGDGGR